MLNIFRSMHGKMCEKLRETLCRKRLFCVEPTHFEWITRNFKSGWTDYYAIRSVNFPIEKKKKCGSPSLQKTWMNVMKNKTYLKVGATSFNEVNWKRTCIDLINKHMKKIRNGNKVMQNQKPTDSPFVQVVHLWFGL